MNAYPPDNLNGTPQIENKEHNWFVVHFLQATKNDEEDKIPSNHLEEHCYFKPIPIRFKSSISQFLPHLYKSWDNTCPDYTEGSVEDLNWCQDLAEEHHIWYGVKCVIQRIWNNSDIISLPGILWGEKWRVGKMSIPSPNLTSRTDMLTKIQEKPTNCTRL